MRLACVKHAASVRSEPGSNSQVHPAKPPQPPHRNHTDPAKQTQTVQHPANPQPVALGNNNRPGMPPAPQGQQQRSSTQFMSRPNSAPSIMTPHRKHDITDPMCVSQTSNSPHTSKPSNTSTNTHQTIHASYRPTLTRKTITQRDAANVSLPF